MANTAVRDLRDAASALVQEVKRRDERITRLEQALSWFVDDETCSLDHDGTCQTHNSTSGCCVADARKLLDGTWWGGVANSRAVAP